MLESGENSIRIIQPGPLTLVQDHGRTGFQKLGVSVSGAIDFDALNIGNRLVGNDANAAGLEVLLGGLEIEFPTQTMFAITGADIDVNLDGVPVSANISYTAHAGSHLAMGMVKTGLRAYVTFAGGLGILGVLGSRSTHISSKIGGFDGRQLAEGDVLSLGDSSAGETSGIVFTDDEFSSTTQNLTIRIVLGPQDDEFSKTGIETLLGSTYTVTDQSNRQGLRLDGPEIESKTGRYDIVSDPVVNGSIQVPGDGKPIILLADRQTTGGYAKIATVASVDLPKLGQTSPGATITFTAISVAEAQQLLVERTARFAAVELGNVVEPVSLRVGGEEITVGVTGNTAAQLAEINGIVYPVSIDEYTPAE
jgi:biotin-dependent carboxylase-like uncharacterized protein